jgi:hypothetical protein
MMRVPGGTKLARIYLSECADTFEKELLDIQQRAKELKERIAELNSSAADFEKERKIIPMGPLFRPMPDGTTIPVRMTYDSVDRATDIRAQAEWVENELSPLVEKAKDLSAIIATLRAV